MFAVSMREEAAKEPDAFLINIETLRSFEVEQKGRATEMGHASSKTTQASINVNATLVFAR